MKKFNAFTLAEILITLGIIGVIAALVMPSLITNYKKHIVVTRMQKFYSVMSQALQKYYAEEGISANDLKFSEYENNDYDLRWYKSTIGKYIQSISVEKEGTRYLKVIFNDGSGFYSYIAYYPTMYIFYCAEMNKNCKPNEMDGRNSFLFEIFEGKLYTSLYTMQYYSREDLLENCKYGNHDDIEVSTPNKRHACARLIQFDSWQIKNDYPWKQVMIETEKAC